MTYAEVAEKKFARDPPYWLPNYVFMSAVDKSAIAHLLGDTARSRAYMIITHVQTHGLVVVCL